MGTSVAARSQEALAAISGTTRWSRHEYLREFEQFSGAYRKGCADLGVDYKVMNTNSNLELALSRVPVPAQPLVLTFHIAIVGAQARLEGGVFELSASSQKESVWRPAWHPVLKS
jgi:hypothetical protein